MCERITEIKCRARVPQVCPVEDVHELCSDLQVVVLLDPEIAADVQVFLRPPRSPEVAIEGIRSKRALRGVGPSRRIQNLIVVGVDAAAVRILQIEWHARNPELVNRRGRPIVGGQIILNIRSRWSKWKAAGVLQEHTELPISDCQRQGFIIGEELRNRIDDIGVQQERLIGCLISLRRARRVPEILSGGD